MDQEKLMQIQQLNQQIQYSQKNIEMLEQQLEELAIAENTIDEIKNTKVGTEILVPIAGGIFAKATLKDNQQLMLNVGAKTAVNKNFEDTKKIIQDQIMQVKDTLMQLQSDIQNLAIQSQIMQQELMESKKQ